MLRLLLRSIAINLASIYIAAQVLSSIISYVGGTQTLLLAALTLAAVNLFVRPVINLLLLPIHLVTSRYPNPCLYFPRSQPEVSHYSSAAFLRFRGIYGSHSNPHPHLPFPLLASAGLV